MDNFSASASVSPITGNITVDLEIEGREITLRIIGDVLDVNARGSIHSRMKRFTPDINLLKSDISVLELPPKIERRLKYNQGIEIVAQIVDSDQRYLFGYHPNKSRKQWLDIVEAALAKQGLFFRMNLEELYPKTSS